MIPITLGTRQERNAVNGNPSTNCSPRHELTLAYLRHFVNVIELWDCVWKDKITDPANKRCMDASSPRRRHARWTKTSQSTVAGSLFGMVECDARVPEALRPYFVEMQPAFKNIRLTHDYIGPFMRRYAQEHDTMAAPHRMHMLSYRGDKVLLATPLLRWITDSM